MATKITKTGSVSSAFTKYGAHSSFSSSFAEADFNAFIAGTDTILNGGYSYKVYFLYGLNFENIRPLLSQNLKITGFTLSLKGGRYNSIGASTYTDLQFRIVSGFNTSTSSTDTSTYTDCGAGSITAFSGSVEAGTVFTLSESNISSTFLTWLNSNIENVLNGYTTNSFGFRFYNRYAQLSPATTVTLDYSYEIDAYTLTVTAGTGGTVTGGGNYESGTTATLKATPATGYKFVKWVNASGATVSTSATYSLSVTADTTLTAVFEKLTYTITFKNEDGTILQASSVAYGDTPKYTGVTPTKASTVEYSYSFSGWSPSIAAVTGAATYTAQFTATKRRYAITVSAGEGGTASGGNTYPYGSTVQISATANEGWEFTGWSDGNTDNPRTITVTGAATYTAVFEEKAPLPGMLDFKIINPRNNMQVTIDNPLEAGQEYLIELTANQ